MKINITNLLSNRKLWIITILFILATLGFIVRLQPLKHGIYLYEFDPYFQYYLTKYLANNGLHSWFELTKDATKDLWWYPIGRDVYKTEYPALAMLGAILYHILKPIVFWLDQETLLIYISVMLPSLMGVLEIIFVYLIVKELFGYKAGLLAALFQAFIPAALDRTIAGFYTKLGFGVTYILIILYFMVKALNSRKMIYAILSGIFFGILCATWGGYGYAFLMFIAYAVLIVITGKNDENFVKYYTVTILLALLCAINVPKISIKILQTGIGLGLLASFLLLLFDLLLIKIEVEHHKRVLINSMLAITIGLGAGIALFLNIVKSIGTRQLSIILPWLREANVLYVSVQEHQMSTWALLYHETGLAFILAPIGIYLLLRERLTQASLLIFTAAITAIYGAVSAAYLMHLGSPFFAIAAGIALNKIVHSAAKELAKEVKIRKGRKIGIKIDPTPIMILLFFIMIVLSLTAYTGFLSGQQIPTIISAEGSVPTVNKVWLKALDYIKNNITGPAVVVAWWDYGYHITVITGKATLCDNSTTNSTQIKWVARALIGDENMTLRILDTVFKTPKNATYLITYEVFAKQEFGGGAAYILIPRGDLAKAIWMIRIGEFNETKFLTRYGEYDWNSPTLKNSTLFKMIIGGIHAMGGQPYAYVFDPSTRQRTLQPLNIDPPKNLKLVKTFEETSGGYTVVVFLYKVSP